VSIARQLAEFGADTHFELLESCLRFELDFESKLVEEVSLAGFGMVKRLKFRAQHVPLRLAWRNELMPGRPAWDGVCTLLPVVTTMDFTAKPCTVAVTPSNDVTRVEAMAFANSDWDPSHVRLVMAYDPGSPDVSGIETCEGGGDSSPFPLRLSFRDEYAFLHGDERFGDFGAAGDLYLARDWELLRVSAGPSQNGEFFAKKSYERSKDVSNFGVTQILTEETHFFLKHTPQKDMPDCP
jgi:hypothetical protein